MFIAWDLHLLIGWCSSEGGLVTQLDLAQSLGDSSMLLAETFLVDEQFDVGL